MIRLAPALCGLVTLTCSATANADCPRQAPGDVADAMRSMYAAVAIRDEAALRARLAPGFYAFEGGVRMDGMALPDMVTRAIAGGKSYQWSVTRPDVQISCALATIAYVNVGAISDAAGSTAVTWLESATLRFEDGRWRVLFLNSTRAPVAAN